MSPVEIRHEPSAYGATRVSIEIGRPSSGRRPWCLSLTRSVSDADSSGHPRPHEPDPPLGELLRDGDAERFGLVERTGEIRAHEASAVGRRAAGPQADPPARGLSERSEWGVRVGVERVQESQLRTERRARREVIECRSLGDPDGKRRAPARPRPVRATKPSGRALQRSGRRGRPVSPLRPRGSPRRAPLPHPSGPPSFRVGVERPPRRADAPSGRRGVEHPKMPTRAPILMPARGAGSPPKVTSTSRSSCRGRTATVVRSSAALPRRARRPTRARSSVRSCTPLSGSTTPGPAPEPKLTTSTSTPAAASRSRDIGCARRHVGMDRKPWPSRTRHGWDPSVTGRRGGRGREGSRPTIPCYRSARSAPVAPCVHATGPTRSARTRRTP